jgi:radical SAM protein with 4Fe4S-binding SPASM domain
VEFVKCYHPWQTCSINELGDVTPCCIYWRKMGSLKRESFESVWNSRRFRKLRCSINTPKPDPICYSCRLPKFDNDESTSFTQLMPSVRDVLGKLWKSRRRTITYAGVMSKEYDPGVAGNGHHAKISRHGEVTA